MRPNRCSTFRQLVVAPCQERRVGIDRSGLVIVGKLTALGMLSCPLYDGASGKRQRNGSRLCLAHTNPDEARLDAIKRIAKPQVNDQRAILRARASRGLLAVRRRARQRARRPAHQDSRPLGQGPTFTFDHGWRAIAAPDDWRESWLLGLLGGGLERSPFTTISKVVQVQPAIFANHIAALKHIARVGLSLRLELH